MEKFKTICLIIVDGWGLSNHSYGNAIKMARTPNFDSYCKIYNIIKLRASGEAVGLPKGQMGNSEVGHLNIGAGRIVYQEFTRINKEIREGTFFKNKVLNTALKRVNKDNSSLHLIGLVSDGGVHSHINHLKALVDLAKNIDIKNLFIHAFLDGRDVPPRSAVPYLDDLQNYLKGKEIGEIASVSGRYYSMDRDNRWDRIKKSYDKIVYRNGKRFKSASDVVRSSYKDNVDDEFVIPSLVGCKNEDTARIKSGDSIIFFNFRPDRARQLTKSFISKEFDKFNRGSKPPKVHFVCMTQYDKKYDVSIAFPPVKLDNTLGEVLSKNALKQLRIAETEKYAHVTFFFNGGVEKPFKGEERILIPSPKVATYDLKPEMSAFEVTDSVIKEIRSKKHDVIILNYANPDMVGHTGKMDAAVKAVEAVDNCVGRVVEELKKCGGLAMITADHGNAEEMLESEGRKTVTSHSKSPVPFIMCNSKIKLKSGSDFKLSDISPTILELMEINKPVEMTGESLIVK